MDNEPSVFLAATADEAELEKFLSETVEGEGAWKIVHIPPPPVLALGTSDIAVAIAGLGGLLGLARAAHDWLKDREATEIVVESRKSGHTRKITLKRKMGPEEIEAAVRALWTGRE